MIIVKLCTILVSGYTSLFVVAWVMLGACLGLSWLVSWQEGKR